MCQYLDNNFGSPGEVTTTTTKAGKFDARFYHMIYEEKIGRVKGHFGPINSLKFHPDGKRWALIRAPLCNTSSSYM